VIEVIDLLLDEDEENPFEEYLLGLMERFEKMLGPRTVPSFPSSRGKKTRRRNRFVFDGGLFE
jgi:hypothetical protein